VQLLQLIELCFFIYNAREQTDTMQRVLVIDASVCLSSLVLQLQYCLVQLVQLPKLRLILHTWHTNR
jgi:hypothetical protein